MEKEESRTEKLARLLAKNKTKLARDKLVSTYRQEINYQINIDQFVDLTVSRRMKRAAYQKISTLQNQKIVKFQQVLSALENLKKHDSEDCERLVVLFYRDVIYNRMGDKTDTGGIYIKMKEFWNVLCQIGDLPLSDIVVIEEKLAFGICIEIEEYGYLLTYWGFD